jgi:hypothetical protein
MSHCSCTDCGVRWGYCYLAVFSRETANEPMRIQPKTASVLICNSQGAKWPSPRLTWRVLFVPDKTVGRRSSRHPYQCNRLSVDRVSLRAWHWTLQARNIPPFGMHAARESTNFSTLTSPGSVKVLVNSRQRTAERSRRGSTYRHQPGAKQARWGGWP